MNNGWPTKTLGDVLQRTETVNPLESPQSEFEYIDVSSVSNKTFAIQETQRLKGKDAPSRARRLVKANDVLFATVRPTLQRIALVPEDLDRQVCSTGYFVLRPKPQVDNRFLFYFLFTDNFAGRMEKLQKGASYPAVTDTDVRNSVIPLPPVAEQQRIVGILDEAFEGIATVKANAEKNFQNARALFESHVQSLFTRRGEGWVDPTLDEVCIVERGSSPRPIKQYFTTKLDGVNWVKIGDTEEGGKYVYSTAQKITLEGARQSRFVSEGDFILTNSMSFGRPYIMKTSGYIHDGWFVLRLKTTIDSDFFYYLLSSRFVQQQFSRLASGAVVKNISGDLVKQAILPVPPLAQQHIIAKKLSQLSSETQRLSSLYQRKLAGLEAFKKSLLHEAFAGKL
jgi:type I restriction enzyme, S subunit